ncbi:MAG: hypothetical protein PHS62_04015 [Patescibacteria group bacterium]|nr:hypothetical protein [Patescibacteria group bacterium]
MRKKLVVILGIILALIVASDFILHQSVVSWRFNNAASASGSMPYQVGLTNAIVIPCVVSSYVCTGGTLCSTILDTTRCALYEDVNGASAGGTGQPPLLLSQIAVQTAGLTMGGQLIYGGTTNSMYLSQDAVLASAGGCYGCTAKAGAVDKIFAWLDGFDKYIIAGFKGK